MHDYTNCSLYDFHYQTYDADNASQSAFTTCTKAPLLTKDFADATYPFTYLTSDIITQVNVIEECANFH